MTNSQLPAARRKRILLLLSAGLLAAICSAGLGYAIFAAQADRHQPTLPPAPADEAAAEDVHRLCGACHAYPPADTFPRANWRKEVQQGYDFFHEDMSLRFPYPPLEAVVRYYENRAPESLPALPQTISARPPAAHFRRQDLRLPAASTPPGVSNINLVHLFSKEKLDVLVCDALGNRVLVYKPYTSPPAWQVLAEGLCCAHAEVVDLDGDGINDVVLACLGNFYATDDRVGSVVWLKGGADGSFKPVTLLDGVGRIADVRAADFTGHGKTDLIVAEFGWHRTGSITLLENQTDDWVRPVFTPRMLDDRHGTTHVPVADLNGDGRPDFVAVISQEHETVVAFLNEGNGRFRKETLYTAPHPTFGSNGVQLVDLDGDGKIDVLLTNGDSLDAPYLLKPYHGLTWLQNRGSYPFTAHRLADGYGAGSPVAADFSGSGRLDIVFVSFLPAEFFPQRKSMKLASITLLEQVSPGEFIHHAIEVESCDHLTCAAGDLTGTGRPDLVIGDYQRGDRTGSGVTVLHNISSKR